MHKTIELTAWRLAICLVGTLCCLEVRADAFGYSGHAYPYSRISPDYPPGLHQEVDRLREQMRRQERQLAEQARMQREQARLMRNQSVRRQQVSAMQACYYRLDAGLDLCDDLFAARSQEHTACHAKVTQKNPACARDVRQSEPPRRD